jgi:hypothetical protein
MLLLLLLLVVGMIGMPQHLRLLLLLLLLLVVVVGMVSVPSHLFLLLLPPCSPRHLPQLKRHVASKMGPCRHLLTQR